MPDLATSALRLSVRGHHGCVDLAVPPWVTLESLGQEYAATTGLRLAPVLVTTTGRPLAPGRPLSELDLVSGDVLVALDPAGASHDDAEMVTRAAPPSRVGPGRSLLLLASVGCALAACLTAALAGAGSEALRVAAVLALLVAAVASGAAVVGADSGLRAARAMSTPAFAGAAGFLLVHSPRPGTGLLALAVGAAVASVAAAVVRAGADARLERLLRVWLIGSGAVAVSAAVALALAVQEQALLAWLFLLAVVAARVLPNLVVDVPDEALLDLDRLAVTAWSARERPRRVRRRTVVRPESVAELVRRGRDLLVAGAVAASLVAVGATLLLARDPGQGLQGFGVHLLLLSGGGALALSARSHREPVPRGALRLPAVLAVGSVLFVGLREAPGGWIWWALAALVVVALGVLLAAAAVGRGWRSLWWARVADIADAAAVVLCVAAFPVASGVVDLVRRLPS